MAQRKKRTAAPKGKAATHGKARKAAKSVRGKTAKRTTAKAAPRKRVTKAKAKRAVAKKVVPTKARRRKSQGMTAVETVIVDVIEEPVPDVMVVADFEATGERRRNENLEQPDESRGAAPPESVER
jgi:hypothetical protein